jgi:hypothetical protein
MILADAGISVWIIGLFVIGIFGFIVSILTIVFRVLGRIVRLVTSGSRPPLPPPPSRPHNVLCSRAGCGHANQPTALYCARCGQPLRNRHDVDTHG